MKSAKVWISIKVDSKFALHVNKCDVVGILTGFLFLKWGASSLFCRPLHCCHLKSEHNALTFTYRYVFVSCSSSLLRNTRPDQILVDCCSVFWTFPSDRLGKALNIRTFVKGKLLICPARYLVCFMTQRNKHDLLHPHDEVPLAALCVSQLSEGLFVSRSWLPL